MVEICHEKRLDISQDSIRELSDREVSSPFSSVAEHKKIK